MIGLVAFVVAIVVIAAAAVILLGTEGTKTYTLKVGDYVKYQVITNTTTLTANMTFEILGVNDTYIFQKQTDVQGSDPPQVYYFNVTKNNTMFALDATHPPAGTAINLVGAETLQLKWGARSAQHYAMSNSANLGDIWIVNGVVAKYDLRGEHYHVTATIIDSNMAQFIG
jgi:asparagine N-glycosylation enzyme membrane subunit Stt3